MQPFRFDKNLVRVLVRKAHDLVLNRGTIPRPHPFDEAGIHRRTLEPRAYNLMGIRVGTGDMAHYLPRVLRRRSGKGEHRHRFVAGLRCQLAVIDRLAINARRRAGLEPGDAKWQLPQAGGERIGRRVAGPAALIVGQADMDAAAEKGAGREYHHRGGEAQAHLRHHPGDPALLHNEILNGLLEQGEARLMLDGLAHRLLIERAVGLGAGGAHRGALARVQGAEMDAGIIGGARHHPPKRIDFLYQMPLADPPDRGITRHLTQGLDVVRQQQGAHARTRRRQCGLGTGMAATHHDDVKAVLIIHSRLSGSWVNALLYWPTRRPPTPAPARFKGRAGLLQRLIPGHRACMVLDHLQTRPGGRHIDAPLLEPGQQRPTTVTQDFRLRAVKQRHRRVQRFVRLAQQSGEELMLTDRRIGAQEMGDDRIFEQLQVDLVRGLLLLDLRQCDRIAGRRPAQRRYQRIVELEQALLLPGEIPAETHAH